MYFIVEHLNQSETNYTAYANVYIQLSGLSLSSYLQVAPVQIDLVQSPSTAPSLTFLLQSSAGSIELRF